MNQVVEFFRKLFDTADWPPRWHCGKWSELHGWMYIISDLLIWSAYFAIPLTILKYLTRRSDSKYVKAYFLFVAFILACGSTHLLDAISFWFPAYRLNALFRLMTGIISWVTVFYLIRILPEATSLRSYTELEKEINEREKAENELRTANTQLNAAQEIARIGYWQWDVINDRIFFSSELNKIYSIEEGFGEFNFSEFLLKIHPEDRELVKENIENAFSSGIFNSFLHRIQMQNGSVKILQARGEVIRDENGKVIRMLGTAQDVTEQQKAQQQLLERSHELEATNADLEKFAYVASHDLQEPLRKTMTFASLLRKESGSELTGRALTYLEKIEQSTGRMQRLIEDILQFSSLKSDAGLFVYTDLNTILQQVLSDMEITIERNHAIVETDRLPHLWAIPSQMGQMFLNLISNALKFKKEDVPPKIQIRSSEITGAQLNESKISKDKNFQIIKNTLNWQREKFIRVTVEDNGIGFEDAYAHKIFEIFQRLHGVRAYTGTGIGLAICKKIVDNHHGIITASGNPGEGAIFTIILPYSQKMFTQKAG